MGFLQRRRSVVLARNAHRMALHFAAGDLFDVPRRYGGFALLAAGHSPKADNVTYGRLNGLPVRAFDLHYEVGHGTRRIMRSYGVVVVETESDLPPLLMWNDNDLAAAPLAARRARDRFLSWSCNGRLDLAEKLAECCRDVADEGVSLQIRDKTVLLCFPLRKRRQDYMGILHHVRRLIERLGLSAAPAAR
jgi:hypothetical protein